MQTLPARKIKKATGSALKKVVLNTLDWLIKKGVVPKEAEILIRDQIEKKL